jgi:hypothetical protein
VQFWIRHPDGTLKTVGDSLARLILRAMHSRQLRGRLEGYALIRLQTTPVPGIAGEE